jgi:REP element-mobilizing transposase RayT
MPVQQTAPIPLLLIGEDGVKGSVNGIDKLPPSDEVWLIKGSVNGIDKSPLSDEVWLMARRLRVEFAGAIYHVINRGDRREEIFRDDQDRVRFLETLAECCTKTDWQVQAFCLMPNHFHLAVETPQPNLVAGMKWFLGTYTSRFNRRHKLFGHLFSGRYQSLLVSGQGGYLRTVTEYFSPNAREMPRRSRWRKRCGGKSR